MNIHIPVSNGRILISFIITHLYGCTAIMKTVISKPGKGSKWSSTSEVLHKIFREMSTTSHMYVHIIDMHSELKAPFFDGEQVSESRVGRVLKPKK